MDSALRRLRFASKRRRLPIRSQIEQIFRRDLSGHDDRLHFLFRGKIQKHATELPDAQPFDLVEFIADRRIGLIGKSSRYDFFYAGCARGVREQQADKRRCRR